MFRTVPLSIIRSFFHCTHSNGICHTDLLKACEQDQDGPDDGQRNCPKHIEFYFQKNKFEKLVHLVGFITRIYHDARSHEREINYFENVCMLLFFLTHVCHDVWLR